MTHDEWAKAVRKELKNRNEKVYKMAANLDRSHEWAYQVISGRCINKTAVQMISEYLGIKNYLEE